MQPHLRGREAAHVRPGPKCSTLNSPRRRPTSVRCSHSSCVQAEEAEHAEQQQRHEQVDVVHPRVLFRVHRIAVRDERQERRVDLARVAVARAAGGREVVRVDARARVARRQVVVRRVAVRAHGRGLVADASGLAVEAVVERLVEVLVAVAAVGRHLLRIATVVGSWIACASWQVAQTGPSLPSRHSAPCALSSHSLRMPLWQSPQVSGLLACEVRAWGRRGAGCRGCRGSRCRPAPRR